MSVHKSSIRDVATFAGVSISTVSHVINSTRFVEPATREKVECAIASLGYRPNLIARSLKSRKTKTIGVVVPETTDDFYVQFLSHFETDASLKGYSIILCDSNGSFEVEKRNIKLLLDKGVDGIVLSTLGVTKSDLDGLDIGVPLVQLDTRLIGLESDFVGIKNKEAALIATQHLIQHGSKRPAFIFAGKSNAMNERLDGYKAALESSAIISEPLSCGLTTKGDSTLDRFFLMHEGIDGVVAGNDFCCFEVFMAARRLGIEIPKRLKIITFDDVKWMKITFPPISTISQPIEDIADQAFSLILNQMRKPTKAQYKSIYLESHLIERESCGEKL
jgi:LacI family transcriptional regulator